MKKFDVGPAMPAFFRLALTTVAVKSLLPNFPHSPLASGLDQVQVFWLLLMLGVCAAEVCVARTRHGEGVFTII